MIKCVFLSLKMLLDTMEISCFPPVFKSMKIISPSKTSNRFCKILIIKGSFKDTPNFKHPWSREAFFLGHVAVQINDLIFGFTGVDNKKGRLYKENDMWEDLEKHASIKVITKYGGKRLKWYGEIPNLDDDNHIETDYLYSTLSGNTLCKDGPFNCLSYLVHVGGVDLPLVKSLKDLVDPHED